MNKDIYVLKKEYEYMLEKLYKENRICLKELDTITNYVMCLQDICNKAIEYMKSIENDYDQDAYMQFKEYKEYQELLNILKGEE